MESFSPELGRDLEGAPVADLGDLQLDASPDRAVKEVEAAIGEIASRGVIPLLLGGEHLLTLGAVRALKAIHPELRVLQIDAHADLRESYQGERLSHATVMRRVAEEVKGIYQVGVRSWDAEEWRWARERGTYLGEGPDTPLPPDVSELPLYLTIDLDLLDPAVCPGVGTPEPGGWSFRELMSFLRRVPWQQVVGVDAVELCPPFDPSGISASAAAKIVREVLLSLL